MKGITDWVQIRSKVNKVIEETAIRGRKGTVITLFNQELVGLCY